MVINQKDLQSWIFNTASFLTNFEIQVLSE